MKSKNVDSIKSVDLHRVRAARAFGVPNEEITTEQRKVGKSLNYKEMFQPDSFNKMFSSL